MTRGRSTEVVLREGLLAEKRRRAARMKLLYVFFLLAFVNLFIFRYLPMYGAIIAFKKYRISQGILGSEWNNFEHFRMLFANPYFFRIMRNSVLISVYRIVFGFPAPILLALLINEVGVMSYKRVVQSISYLPHFMSWVVLAGIVMEILSPQRGLVRYLFLDAGHEVPNLLIDKRHFRALLVATDIWKEVGWGTVVYLAAMSSIDPGLYESAEIDGTTRLQRAWHITLPSLVPVISIIFILRLGYILDAGFDQIFNLYNPVVYEVADILDTYVYRVGLVERRYDFSAAVGLFKNVVGLLLLLGANALTRRVSEYGLW